MHILIVGDFQGKDEFTAELERYRHYVTLATNASSALDILDEIGGHSDLIIVPQGPSAKWMGTILTEGLKARLLKKTVIFVVTVDDDSIELLHMQIKLQDDGLTVLAMHPPLFFNFIADQLHPVGVNLFNIQ